MSNEHERVQATQGGATRASHDHVLIVDGDEQFALDIAGAVLSLGLSASSAGSGPEAIDVADRQRPTLVVADVDVGGELAGVGVADTIRRRWGSSIILMSTRTDRETVAAIAAADANGVLCKPFHWRQFEVTLRLALERRAARPDEPTTAAPDLSSYSNASKADLEIALRRIAAEISRIGFGNLLPEYTPNQEWLAAMRPREREVVSLLLQHHRVPAIARTLSISPATVRNHLKSVFRQMGVHSQQELLLILQQRNPHQPVHLSDQPSTADA